MLISNVGLLGELSDSIDTSSGAILVEGGKITRVFERTPKNFAGEVFDACGMWALPGLIDAHTHIAGLRDYGAHLLKNPMGFFVQTALFTQRYLDYGFTTVRDCGVALRVDVAVRDAIDAGLFRGPHVLASGLIISPIESPADDPLTEIYSWISGAEEARKAARQELAAQVDFIKVMATGSALDRHGIPKQPTIFEDELRALVDTAALKSSYVAAHAHADEAIKLCAVCGVRTIEHASFISTDTAETVKAQDSCWLIPTISAMYQNPDTTDESFAYLIEKLQTMLHDSSQCLEAAYKMEVPMGFGTDSCPGMDQYEKGIEFSFRHECCHMSPIDILLQATKYNAQALRISEHCGEIKAGLDADIILVDKNPADDISVMSHKPEVVFLGGEKVRG